MLHETQDTQRHAQIDTAGWIFVAFVVAIIAIGAVVAYNGNTTIVATTAISHNAKPPG